MDGFVSFTEPLPADSLAGLSRAAQYAAQKEYWRKLTQLWRAEVVGSLHEIRAVIERQQKASERIRDTIRAVVWAAEDPGRLSVADIVPLAQQWADDADPSLIGARDGQYRLWRCTVEPAHGTWKAPPKDRTRADRPSMCPRCSGAAPHPSELPARERSLAAIPGLARELHSSSGRPEETSYGSKNAVKWQHQVPAVRPGSGDWYLATHVWDQPPKSRTSLRYSGGQAVGVNGCSICNSDQADESNSLASWYPELAEQWVSALGDRSPLNTPVGSKIEVMWRCIEDESHENWPAPPNRRTATALRSGCPRCSKNISDKQVALFHELRLHLPALELEAPILLDPEPGQRFRGVRVDMWDEALHLVVEFDGWKMHGPAGWRDRAEHDRIKTERLHAAGETVIRVREDLEPAGPHDVVVGSGWNAWKVAVAVLERVRQLGLHPLPELDAYAARGGEAAVRDTEAALLGRRYEPRKFPEKPKPPAAPRTLKATPPPPESRLTPIGPPYSNPIPRQGALRNYKCVCGNRCDGLRQVDVTRGNTLSCGCLAEESRNKLRGSHDRALTQAARQWALGKGITVSRNGALEARILASYQLHVAGLETALGPDQLIPTSDVTAWMSKNGIQPVARGRIPSQAWHGFADSYADQAQSMASCLG